MLIKDWQDLPDNMKNEEVKEYYDYLKRKNFSLLMKRCFDIVGSLLLLVLLLPVFLVIGLCIKFDSSGPIFYRQERVTQYGLIFRIYKFRTMVEDADQKGALITSRNDSRITRVGMKIRRSRLDEVPQLINVLKGEMSLVGTRPEVEKYVSKYSQEMMATLLLPAGVTSLASIEFKDEDNILKEKSNEKNIGSLYVEEILPLKMQFNLEYLKNVSLLYDFKLCVKTILEVIK